MTDRSRASLGERLARFSAESSPRYAVLVDGPWGVGKTFQVRTLLAERQIEYTYVSLAGLASVDAMYAEILLAGSPKGSRSLLDNITASLDKVKGLVGAGVAFTAGVFGALARHRMNLDRLIIVDDVERSTIDIREIVGTLNDLVEHRGARLVLIANTREIPKPEGGTGFDEIREKVIGPTFTLGPDIPLALGAFIEQAPCSDAVRGTLVMHRSLIEALYVGSRMNSLRVLRLSLLDLARFFECWSTEQREHDGAVDAGIQWLMPYAVAKYAGWFHHGLPRNRMELFAQYLTSGDKRERLKSDAAKARDLSVAAPSVELDDAESMRQVLDRFGSSAIRNDSFPKMLLEDAFERDRYDATEVQKALKDSAFFASIERDPPWQTLIYFRQNEDDVVDAAIRDLEDGLSGARYSAPSDLLEAFSVRLFLAQTNAIDVPPDEIVSGGKALIDRLAGEARLEPLPVVSHGVPPVRERGFKLNDTHAAAFTELRDHLKARRFEVRKNTYDEVIERLLDTLREHGLRPSMPILGTDPQFWTLQSVPVLADLDPNRFVDAWLASPRVSWLGTKEWLQARYHGPMIAATAEGIGAETTFLDGVIERLEAESGNASGLSRVRLQSLVIARFSE